MQLVPGSPAKTYLGIAGRLLKLCRKRFQPGGQCFEIFRDVALYPGDGIGGLVCLIRQQ